MLKTADPKVISYTERNYIPAEDMGTMSPNLDLIISSKQFASGLEIYPDNFVAGVNGNVTLRELDEKLKEQGLETLIKAPPDYSMSRILSENWGVETKRSCLGLGLRHADGTETKIGGQVIKNVSGLDLTKIYLGSCNALAVITSAYLRLDKMPEKEVKLVYRLEEFPGDFSKYNFHWDNYTVDCTFDKTSSMYANDHYYLTVSLWGDLELLEIRKKRVHDRLGAWDEIKETDYQGKQYPGTEFRLEYYTRPSNLHEFVDYFVTHIKKIKLKAYPRYGRVDVYPDNVDEFSLDIQKLKSGMLQKDYFVHVYPITYTNRILERKINLHANEYEKNIIRQLKKAYDPDCLLNPGILLGERIK